MGYKPETCRAERTQVNTQLHQVGKLFNIPGYILKLVLVEALRYERDVAG